MAFLFEKFVSRVSSAFGGGLNQATLSGAIDIIVAETADGLVSTPFHVRFGKLQLLRVQEHFVTVSVNGNQVECLMKLASDGEAFFVEECVDLDSETALLDESIASPADGSCIASQESELPVTDEKLQQLVNTVDINPTPEASEVSSSLGMLGSSSLSSIDVIPVQDDIKTHTRTQTDLAVTGKFNQSRTIFEQLGSFPRSKSLSDVRDVVKDSTEHKVETSHICQSYMSTNKHKPRSQTNATLLSSPSSYAPSFTFASPATRPAKPYSPAVQASDDHFEPFMEISLCGQQLGFNIEENMSIFKRNVVTYDQLCENPYLVFESDLVMRYDTKLYPARVALPMLLSYLLFGKHLSPPTLQRLAEEVFWQDVFRRNCPSGLGMATLQSVGFEDGIDDTESVVGPMSMSPQHDSSQETPKFYRRTFNPSSATLKQFGLNYGKNSISFSVQSKLQGKQRLKANIFLWRKNTKIVVSDVDGTITKSDLLGNIMPLMGKDWSHHGVVELFSHIQKNGYQFVYLTSRSIGQANITRGFLNSLRQHGKPLPEGPLIMSPDSLLLSFRREVVDRKPQEFKIEALQKIASLFLPENNPFYAGFGNRDTDVVSYGAVGVPHKRVFIINPKGEVVTQNAAFKRTYRSLNDIASFIFPPCDISSPSVGDAFNSFQFWRVSMPELCTLPSLDDDNIDSNGKQENIT